MSGFFGPWDIEAWQRQVGEKLRWARGEAGIRDISTKARLSTSTIRRVEQGSATSFAVVYRLARLYSLSLDDLAGRAVSEYTWPDELHPSNREVREVLQLLAKIVLPPKGEKEPTPEQKTVLKVLRALYFGWQSPGCDLKHPYIATLDD